MDETPAYFDIVASKSVDKVGVKQCVIRSTGAEKRHLTVVLTVTSDGNMLHPLIIFKGRPTGKIIEMELLEGMVAVRQEKGWMDTKVMHVYLEKIWYPYVLKVGGEAVKSLLVCMGQLQCPFDSRGRRISQNVSLNHHHHSRGLYFKVATP